MVVRRTEPFTAPRECIIVPRDVAPGLISALHIRLGHPTTNQLKQIVQRAFYIINADSLVTSTTQACSTCSALQKFPRHFTEQSTGEPPAAIGISFAADVLKCEKQVILVIRENVTAYTEATIIEN